MAQQRRWPQTENLREATVRVDASIKRHVCAVHTGPGRDRRVLRRWRVRVLGPFHHFVMGPCQLGHLQRAWGPSCYPLSEECLANQSGRGSRQRLASRGYRANSTRAPGSSKGSHRGLQKGMVELPLEASESCGCSSSSNDFAALCTG